MIINCPIVLTSVIATSTTHENQLTNEETRLFEARKALFLLIQSNLFNKIVIVDGSNFNILTDHEVKFFSDKSIEIEQITFKQNTEDVRLFGKSNGEQQIMNYMLNNSLLVKKSGCFYKLSSRYFMLNMEQVLGNIKNLNNVFFYFNPPLLRNSKPFICTSFYKTSVSFYKEYLADSISDCNLTSYGCLEAVYFKKINECNKKGVLTEFPFFAGLSGTLGTAIENRFYNTRNLLSKLGILAYSFNSND